MDGADLTQIDSIDVVTAMTVISEVGWHMSKWETDNHFVSWLKLSPNNKISGVKIIGRARRPTNNRAAAVFLCVLLLERRLFLARWTDGFTEVFFNADHGLGLVEEGIRCSSQCGNWTWVVLEHKKGRWEMLRDWVHKGGVAQRFVLM